MMVRLLRKEGDTRRGGEGRDKVAEREIPHEGIALAVIHPAGQRFQRLGALLLVQPLHALFLTV